MGLYYFDENMAHGFSQAFTRFTSEALQTYVGYVATQGRNFLGQVDRVDYFCGATYATDEYSSDHQGFTLGPYINMYINGKISTDKSFRDWVITSDQMYLHEYGHTIQSQMLGPAYLGIIGLPSLISCSFAHDIDINGTTFYSHDLFYTELSANTYAYLYFSIYYNFNWETNWQKYPRWSDLFRL